MFCGSPRRRTSSSRQAPRPAPWASPGRGALLRGRPRAAQRGVPLEVPPRPPSEPTRAPGLQPLAAVRCSPPGLPPTWPFLTGSEPPLSLLRPPFLLAALPLREGGSWFLAAEAAQEGPEGSCSPGREVGPQPLEVAGWSPARAPSAGLPSSGPLLPSPLGGGVRPSHSWKQLQSWVFLTPDPLLPRCLWGTRAPPVCPHTALGVAGLPTCSADNEPLTRETLRPEW